MLPVSVGIGLRLLSRVGRMPLKGFREDCVADGCGGGRGPVGCEDPFAASEGLNEGY